MTNYTRKRTAKGILQEHPSKGVLPKASCNDDVLPASGSIRVGPRMDFAAGGVCLLVVDEKIAKNWEAGDIIAVSERFVF